MASTFHVIRYLLQQAIICDEAIKDTVLDELKKQGAHFCNSQEKAQLERTIQTPRRTLNTRIVGKSAVKIAEMAGFSVPSNTRARRPASCSGGTSDAETSISARLSAADAQSVVLRGGYKEAAE